MLGRKFFEGQLPQLIRNIGRLADELKRYNDAREAEERQT
jgi:Sec-independent protein translocase protein TatA